MFNIKLMIILFLSTLLLGCESIPPPSHTPVVAPTVAATEENFASDNMSALASIEPIITGYRLRFDSWSADSKWIGYWVADGDNLPAHLGFVNSQSGESCLQKEIISSNLENSSTFWADHNVYVLNGLDDVLFAGKPCETFSPTGNNFALDDPGKHVSPNNQYQAVTTIKEWEGQIIHNVTEISEITSGKVISTFAWKGSPHVWAENGWLNNDLYLIGLDFEQGALYFSASSRAVGNVVTDMLGISDLAGNIFHVGRYANQDTGHFHLLIERYDEKSELPILLYHSEDDSIEEIPFARSWIINGSNFTPDGKWIFVRDPLPRKREDIPNFWIHPIESSDDEVSIELSKGMGFLGFSDKSNKIVFVGNGNLQILSFPEGQAISQWNTIGYSVDRAWWSPDGEYLALQGFSRNGQSEAIFLIRP